MGRKTMPMDEARPWLAGLPFKRVNPDTKYGDGRDGVPEGGAPMDPHEYVILGWEEVQQPEFGLFVNLIREDGYKGRYRPPYNPDKPQTNTYLEVDGWVYWFIYPRMLNRQRADQVQHERLPEQEKMPV